MLILNNVLTVSKHTIACINVGGTSYWNLPLNKICSKVSSKIERLRRLKKYFKIQFRRVDRM